MAVDSIIVFGKEGDKTPTFLKKMGYEVTECVEPQALIKATGELHPDLLVIDGRNDFEGVELLAFLRSEKQTSDVPVLYLSPDEEDTAIVSAEKYNLVEILTEPFRVGTLVSKVATNLRLRKLKGADEETATLGEINARLRDLNATFTKQLEEAREIQFALVPASLPKDDRFSIAASYEPLEEVGGDWYYVQQEEDGKIRVHCGDVTGHGLSAAFIGSMTKLAMTAAGARPPHEQLQEMNRLMAPNIPPGKFVTMFSFLYDPETGVVTAARAGHPPALLVRRQLGEVQQIMGDGFAIGFFEDSEYTIEIAELDPGDLIVTYSDAIPESQNMAGDTYDYDRVSEVLLNSPPEATATELLLMILNDFDDFREGRVLKDDVTVVLLKRDQ